MNHENLPEQIPYLSYAFRTLSPEEQLKLEHSLRNLQRAQRLQSVYFLGKLEGQDSDYYLAFGCPGQDVFNGRKLFYSLDLIDWYLLLEPKSWNPNWEQIQSPFHGDPAFQLTVDFGPQFSLDENLVPVKGANKVLVVKEQDRLWFVVTRLLEEAAVVPRGVLYHTTEGQSVINPFFDGMCCNDSLKLHNYHYFRQPVSEPAVNLLKRDRCSYFFDVFDPADECVPKEHSFAMSRDPMRDVFTLTSLQWPGMVNFHRANSKAYGFFYFGDGRKNWNLMFKI
ncbi:radial spoke head protein 9 homolog [Wyeomyia smithii]|uniref:radial spoke head protein 9 homolog n=1 Tax=Wyeomyia smithii TaxID=174621 RepID=UPI002467BDD6|nr:radial spoke head protein 9 homolog [Wyeomyia smithii]